MQGIEGSHGYAVAMLSHNLDATVESSIRQLHFHPEPCLAIALEVQVEGVCRGNRKPFPQNMLGKSVRPLNPVQRSQPHRRISWQQPPSPGGMLIGHVQRDQEA